MRNNAAVDLLADKVWSEVSVITAVFSARVTEQSLSKTMDARIAAHANYGELRELRKRMEQMRGVK